MAPPTSRGAPVLGWWCMRMPGPRSARRSLTTGRAAARCRASSGRRRRCRGPRRGPRARRPGTHSGCTRSVTSSAVPPVERFALSRSQTVRPSSGTDSGSSPCVREMHESGVVEPYRRQRLLVAFASPRILVGDRHELTHGTGPVAGNRWRLAPARRDDAAADDENAIVIAHQHLLDDDPRASAACARWKAALTSSWERTPTVDAFSLIAVERLDTTGAPISSKAARASLFRLDDLALGHRDERPREHSLRRGLVLRDLDRDRAGRIPHGRSNQAPVCAVSELHQALVVEPLPRDVPARSRIHDRLRAGAEPRVVDQAPCSRRGRPACRTARHGQWHRRRPPRREAGGASPGARTR